MATYTLAELQQAIENLASQGNLAINSLQAQISAWMAETMKENKRLRLMIDEIADFRLGRKVMFKGTDPRVPYFTPNPILPDWLALENGLDYLATENDFILITESGEL